MDADTEEASAKASALIESLPWLRLYQGSTVVIKFGGNAMINEDLKRAFAADMVYLRQVGVFPVVVHGGGPQISAELERRGIPSEFRGGLRVTSAEALEVVREVLTSRVGPELAALINEYGDLAEPISGETDGLFVGTRRGTTIDGEEIDLGLVGDVTAVDPSVVRAIVDAGRIPVVSSIAPEGGHPGRSLNVNADAAASSLAIALGAAKLIVLTDVAGLYSDWPNRDSLVSVIDAPRLRSLLPTLESGMIPKMTACLDAVDGGVHNASIIDGRVPHAILLEAFTAEGNGTQVISGKEES